MLFLRYSSSFYVFFKKCSNIFVTLIYELEQKNAQNAGNRISDVLDLKFPGGGYPRTPPPPQMRDLMYSMHQSAQELDPPLDSTDCHHHNFKEIFNP
jgi:hypothetical protein